MLTPILGIPVSTFVASISLVGLALIVLCKSVGRRFVKKGEKAVYENIAMPLSVIGWGMFGIGGYLYIVSASLTQKQAAIIEAIFIFNMPLSTAMMILVLLSGLLHRSIELSEIDLNERTNSAPVLAIAHLSDSHIPEGLTMEGELGAEDVSRALAAAVSWAHPRSNFLFFTGDATDTGSEGEWARFQRICEDSGIDRKKLLLIPGNHDISLETGFSPLNRNITEGFERRCLNYVKNTIVDCPPSWEFIYGNRSYKIQRYFDGIFSSYLKDYHQYPPRVEVLPAKPISKWYLQAQEKLIESAKKFERNGFCWPTESKPLVSDLMEILFPIVFFHNDDFVIIGLNSNTEGSYGVIDGAFGKLGGEQIRKLAAILEAAKARKILILVHHHVGIPKRIVAEFGKSGFQLKFLQLRDAKKLLKLADKHDVTIFHGHKHVAYTAMHNNTVIVSAGSICYGDIASGRDAATIFAIPTRGPIERSASCNFSTKVAASSLVTADGYRQPRSGLSGC